MLLAVAIAGLIEAAGAPAPVAAPQAPGYGPTLPTPPRPVRSAAADAKCASERAAAVASSAAASSAASSTTAQDIIVCAPPGYRLNPDVLAAKRDLRGIRAGRPVSPHEPFRDNNCATIGPMGCRGGATINLVNAAMVAATMVATALKGGNVGAMFVTGHEPTEYELYQQAKAAREATEAAAAAKAKGKSAGAAAKPAVINPPAQ